MSRLTLVAVTASFLSLVFYALRVGRPTNVLNPDLWAIVSVFFLGEKRTNTFNWKCLLHRRDQYKIDFGV